MVLLTRLKNKQSGFPIPEKMPKFNFPKLASVCASSFTKLTEGFRSFRTPYGNYHFKNNNGKILGVAHLDHVQDFKGLDTVRIGKHLLVTAGNLDNRLGVYILLHYLTKFPQLEYDILLTENEEVGMSTGGYFTPPIGKYYNWIFSFDRPGGQEDAVLYNYDDVTLRRILANYNIITSPNGLYSDIYDLEHLGVKGINFQSGVMEWHSPDAFADVDQAKIVLNKFLRFSKDYVDIRLDHTRGNTWREYEKRYQYLSGPHGQALYSLSPRCADVKVPRVIYRNTEKKLELAGGVSLQANTVYRPYISEKKKITALIPAPLVAKVSREAERFEDGRMSSEEQMKKVSLPAYCESCHNSFLTTAYAAEHQLAEAVYCPSCLEESERGIEVESLFYEKKEESSEVETVVDEEEMITTNVLSEVRNDYKAVYKEGQWGWQKQPAKFAFGFVPE